MFGVRMPYFLEKLLYLRHLIPYQPSFYGVFSRHTCCKYGGWGLSRLLSESQNGCIVKIRRGCACLERGAQEKHRIPRRHLPSSQGPQLLGVLMWCGEGLVAIRGPPPRNSMHPSPPSWPRISRSLAVYGCDLQFLDSDHKQSPQRFSGSENEETLCNDIVCGCARVAGAGTITFAAQTYVLSTETLCDPPFRGQ